MDLSLAGFKANPWQSSFKAWSRFALFVLGGFVVVASILGAIAAVNLHRNQCSFSPAPASTATTRLKVLFVRHAESFANANFWCKLRENPSLTDNGISECNSAQDVLSRVFPSKLQVLGNTVYASWLSRTVLTALLVFPGSKVQISPFINENGRQPSSLLSVPSNETSLKQVLSNYLFSHGSSCQQASSTYQSSFGLVQDADAVTLNHARDKETPNWGSFLEWLGPHLLSDQASLRDLQNDADSKVLCVVTHGNFLETCVLPEALPEKQKAANCQSFYLLLPYSFDGGSISFGRLEAPSSSGPDQRWKLALEQIPPIHTSTSDRDWSIVRSGYFWGIFLAVVLPLVVWPILYVQARAEARQKAGRTDLGETTGP